MDVQRFEVVDKIEISRRLSSKFQASDAPLQKDVAHLAGVPTSTLSQWLAGDIPSGAVQVSSVGCALGMRPDELYLEDHIFKARKSGAPNAGGDTAAELSDLCAAADKLADFTGPEGVRMLTDHCKRLVESFVAQATSKIKPALPSGQPALAAPRSSPLYISEKLRLSDEEARAFRQYLATQAKTMPWERPLTIALRKIATLLSRGSALRKPLQGPGTKVEVLGPAAKDESSGVPRRRPTGRRTEDH